MEKRTATAERESAIAAKARRTASRPVLVIDGNGRADRYPSENAVIDEFKIPNIHKLRRMIEEGSTWKDGRTTFDLALS